MNDSQLRSPFHYRVWFFFLLWSIFAIACFAWSFTSPLSSLSDPPVIDRDDVYFDNISYNLAEGEGFRLDFAKPTWRETYLSETEVDDRQRESNEWIAEISVVGPTAARAPAYPIMLSYSYRFFGRQWVTPRLINFGLLSLGLALIVFYVGRQFESPLVPVIASLTLLGDFGIFGFATKIVTEPMAVFAVAGLFVTVVAASRSNSFSPWLVAGLAFGAATLVRSNMNSWVLMLIVLSAIGLTIGPRLVGERRTFFGKFLLFLLGTVIVAGPWWYRNCQVTKHFEPLGTGGKIGWVGGYCDEALDRGGNWQLHAVLKQQNLSIESRQFRDTPLAVREYYMGRDSFQAGIEWMKSNWKSIPKLMVLKAISHLGFYNHFHIAITLINLAMMISACIGFVMSWKRFGGWATLVLFLSIATAMITWAHYGRYSIPVRPLIHLGSAVTGAWLIHSLFENWLPDWLKHIQVTS